jgi:hypothetical protein
MKDTYTITATDQNGAYGKTRHTPITLLMAVHKILFEVGYKEIKVEDCKGQVCLHAKRNPAVETGWQILTPENYPVSRMEKRYREEKEKENLPYHHRNLNLP